MLLGSVAVAAASIIPLAGVAGAQSSNASPCAQGGPNYPPGQQGQGLTVSPNSFRRGDNGNARGCAGPNSRFNRTLFSHPKPLGTGTADGTGFYSFGFQIPCDTEDGGHTLVVQGQGVVDGSASLTVNGTNTAVCGAANAVGNLGQAGRQAGVARASGGGGGALARTGSASAAPLTAAGVGLVLIGSAAVVVTRRRRSDAASVS